MEDFSFTLETIQKDKEGVYFNLRYIEGNDRVFQFKAKTK